MKLGSERTNLLLELSIDVIKRDKTKKVKMNKEWNELKKKEKRKKEKRLYLEYNNYNSRFRIYCNNVSRKITKESIRI